jgi:hypothetical protein
MVSVFSLEKDWISNETLKLFTDSSGNPELGCGVYFNGLWAQLRWPWRNSHLMKNMSFLEMVPLVLAMFLWVTSLENKNILFYIDNSALATSLENNKILFYIDSNALVSIVNKRSSKDTWIMKMIRPFVLITMKHNVQFKAIHIKKCQQWLMQYHVFR